MREKVEMGGVVLAEILTYKKPNLNDLPVELGMEIIRQILNSPVPDREKMKMESQRLIKENVKIREREIAQGNSSK